MRGFNKVVTILILVIGFFVLPIVAAVPAEALRFVQDATFTVESWLTPVGRLATSVGAIVLWIVTIALLWFEVRPARMKEIPVSIPGGEASVSASSVARRLEQALEAIGEVRDVRARVVQGKEGVEATLVLSIVGDVNVPAITTTAVDLARRILREQVGAGVGKVSVRVRQLEAGRRLAPVAAGPSTLSQPAERLAPEPASATPMEAGEEESGALSLEPAEEAERAEWDVAAQDRWDLEAGAIEPESEEEEGREDEDEDPHSAEPYC